MHVHRDKLVVGRNPSNEGVCQGMVRGTPQWLTPCWIGKTYLQYNRTKLLLLKP